MGAFLVMNAESIDKLWKIEGILKFSGVHTKWVSMLTNETVAKEPQWKSFVRFPIHLRENFPVNLLKYIRSHQ